MPHPQSRMRRCCRPPAALATSGTVSTELALAGAPMVIAYKIGGVSYQLMKRLVTAEHITLFNIAANRPGAFASAANVSASSFAPVTITLPDGSKSTAAVTPVFSQVFGVAVTAKLYTALQTAQGTTGIPSLSRDYLANFFSNNVLSVGFLPLGVANSDAGINVCFREIGRAHV